MDYSTSLLTLIAWKILPDELRYVTLTIRGCCDRPRVRIRVPMSCGEMLFHHTILNTSIKSPLSLRDSSVVKPNILSLSGYDIFLRSGKNREISPYNKRFLTCTSTIMWQIKRVTAVSTL